MNKILVTLPLGASQRERLECGIAESEFVYVALSEVTQEQVQEADIIVGNVPPAYLSGSKRLKLLQLSSAGTDGYTAPGVLAPETALTNATGAYGQAVAEHMFGMMMMLQKKLHRYRDDRHQGKWGDHGHVTSVANACVMVIGLGDIGKYFAGMAKALGAYVIGVKRRPSKCPEMVDELLLMEEMEGALPRADVVFSVLPNTPSTRRIYDQDFFAKMKDTAFFLNGGRGNAVDQEALLKAVQNGWIKGAALDVTDPEPLPSSDPLWQEPDIFITPHVSGQYHLPETLDKIVAITAANIKACLAGAPLKNEVDFTTGYCK